MPTLSCFFAIYTNGEGLHDSFPSPAGTDVFLGEMGTLIVPGSKDELFGPHANIFQRVKPKRGFLLGFHRKQRGRAETFFREVRTAVMRATLGVHGVGLDILRLTPFPLETASDALPEDMLAEDLFAVGFTEMGEHGLRAETIGLSKLGQREITFEFTDAALMEEAALMCGHLADYLLDHNKRIVHGQSMSFGFDRITFFSAEGAAGGPFRGWHPPLVQKLLPEELFPGVGVLEVHSFPPSSGVAAREDLTIPLRRALEQRTVLEELDLTGDSPHSTATAQVKGFITELKELVAVREESMSSKDSGWRFRNTARDSGENGVMTLADLARRVPEIVRYLALPHGVKLSWNEQGLLEVDNSRVELDEEETTDDS